MTSPKDPAEITPQNGKAFPPRRAILAFDMCRKEAATTARLVSALSDSELTSYDLYLSLEEHDALTADLRAKLQTAVEGLSLIHNSSDAGQARIEEIVDEYLSQLQDKPSAEGK